MLLVIFGAGASYDSVLHLPPPPPPNGNQNYDSRSILPERPQHEDSRPPQANQLFEDRRLFVHIMNEYGACKPLINLLRGDVQVERQLAKFEQEAKTFPPRYSQLAAIRYYLHQMLWTCEQTWHNYHSGITNYATFVDAIDRWGYENNEQVWFVTFNYDTMLEQSFAGRQGAKFNDFNSYISDPRCKLIKLHGSVDWGLEFNAGGGSKLPKDVIEAATNGIDVSKRYRKIVQVPANLGDGTHGFPALAIPVEKKSEFVCPPEHLSALADILPKVTKIITIGWRATEQHFLKMLQMRLTGLQGNVDLMVVSGSSRGVTETTANLGLIIEPSDQKYDGVENGFSGLIKDLSRLEAFLQ